MNNLHTGSNFDDFLKEEGILEESHANALKFMLAHELEKKMEEQHLSKSEVARQLHTSRTAINRLLDPTNTSITLQTLTKLANFVGKRLNITLTESHS